MFASAFWKPKPNEYYHNFIKIFEYQDDSEYNEEDKKELEEAIKAHKEDIKKKLEITEELVEKLKKYDTIILGHNFNSSIDNLPDNIKKILWSNSYFNHPIKKFPKNLEILDFSGLIWNNNFKDIKICEIPNTVKVIKGLLFKINIPNLPTDLEVFITRGDEFIKYFKLLEPLKKVKKIVIGDSCISNDETETNLNILPSSLEILSINGAILFELANLPIGLKKLELNTEYVDFSLDLLPSSLEELYIGCRKYNKPIDMLPSGLKKLTFQSSEFIHPISLPDNLEILNLQINPTKVGLIIFPKNLKNLILNIMSSRNQILVFESYTRLLGNNFPLELLNLTISIDFLSNNIVLPPNLVSLKIFNPDVVIHGIPEFSFGLPDSLKYLNIGKNINFKFINMPKSLECLYLYDGFNLELPELPESLKLFYFEVNNYPYKLPKFNEGLKHLYLSYYNNNPECEIKYLPDSLESLYLKYIINDDFIFPSNLKYLGYNPFYNFKLNEKEEVNDLEEYNESIKNEVESKVIELNNKILNSMPDSIEIFSTDIDFSKNLINQLPIQLKEIGILNRDVTNEGFDYIKYFKECGCTNNFTDIILYLVEDYSEIKYFNGRINEYFNYYNKYEYNYSYDYNYDI